MVIYIKTDRSETRVIPKNSKRFSLKELQKFVGGKIEIIELPSGCAMYLNEEGKLEGLLENEKATEIWKSEYPIEKYPVNNDESVVGNVLIFTKKEHEKQNAND